MKGYSLLIGIGDAAKAYGDYNKEQFAEKLEKEKEANAEQYRQQTLLLQKTNQDFEQNKKVDKTALEMNSGKYQMVDRNAQGQVINTRDADAYTIQQANNKQDSDKAALDLTKAQTRKEGLDADYAEASMPNRVRGSSLANSLTESEVDKNRAEADAYSTKAAGGGAGASNGLDGVTDAIMKDSAIKAVVNDATKNAGSNKLLPLSESAIRTIIQAQVMEHKRKGITDPAKLKQDIIDAIQFQSMGNGYNALKPDPNAFPVVPEAASSDEDN